MRLIARSGRPARLDLACPISSRWNRCRCSPEPSGVHLALSLRSAFFPPAARRLRCAPTAGSASSRFPSARSRRCSRGDSIGPAAVAAVDGTCLSPSSSLAQAAVQVSATRGHAVFRGRPRRCAGHPIEARFFFGWRDIEDCAVDCRDDTLRRLRRKFADTDHRVELVFAGLSDEVTVFDPPERDQCCAISGRTNALRQHASGRGGDDQRRLGTRWATHGVRRACPVRRR